MAWLQDKPGTNPDAITQNSSRLHPRSAPQDRPTGHARIDPKMAKVLDPAMVVYHGAAIDDHTLAQPCFGSDDGPGHDGIPGTNHDPG